MPLVHPLPDLVTIPEAARMTGYSKSGVHYRVTRGLIEAERDERGVWRVPVSEVARLVRRQRYARPESCE
ncbi:MAG: hypothetical protein Rubg2KO_16780 [Rubricoccaceae bacterium]